MADVTIELVTGDAEYVEVQVPGPQGPPGWVLLYNENTGSYPARPDNARAATWMGPVDPVDAGATVQDGDIWIDTA